MYHKIHHIHLIGVGGIGMSGIAELLVRNGYTVSGSDLGRNDSIRHLESLGVRVFQGHNSKHLEGVELVVYSSAVTDSNEELKASREKNIPAIPRAEMLAELMRLKYGIAVAGAHGKTTTTSMIALALIEGGVDPTVVVGGRLDNFGGTNARMGQGEFMVVEADESDGSFNRLTPCIAVVTNVDREHMNYYKNMRNLKKAFGSFLSKVPFYGLSVYCGDDPYLRNLSAQMSRRKISYGFRSDNHYAVKSYAAAEITECRVHYKKETFRLHLSVPGRHNVCNALAALAVADELGIPRGISLEALLNFKGVQRRFHLRGEKRGVLFVDDYAHHPREISATLAAARERYPNAKIRAIFQPHRYSRVEDLFDEFSTCFKGIHSVAVTDIYSAGEDPIEGIDSSFLAQNISGVSSTPAKHIPKPADAIEELLGESEAGDIIVTLGAGDLPRVYKDLF